MNTVGPYLFLVDTSSSYSSVFNSVLCLRRELDYNDSILGDWENGVQGKEDQESLSIAVQSLYRRCVTGASLLAARWPGAACHLKL